MLILIIKKLSKVLSVVGAVVTGGLITAVVILGIKNHVLEKRIKNLIFERKVYDTLLEDKSKKLDKLDENLKGLSAEEKVQRILHTSNGNFLYHKIGI